MKGLVTGSFDPITLGHMEIIRNASNACDELVVCMFNNDTKEYFFTKEERLQLIKLAVDDIDNVTVDVSIGYVYQYCLDNSIDCIYRGYRNAEDYTYEQLMSEYNYANSNVKTVLVESKGDIINISSTKIRELINNSGDWHSYIPGVIFNKLNEFVESRKR